MEWPRIGGALCLDFCNTVSWRLTPEPVDRLGNYADLRDWAGLPAAPDAPDTFARALELRARIIAAFEAPAPGDLEAVRGAYAEAVAAGRARVDGGAVVLDWPDDPDRPLWMVAHSAWTLLTDANRPPVRVCEGRGCGWLFLDETRNASRRWCSDGDCGRRERVRRHRARRAAAG